MAMTLKLIALDLGHTLMDERLDKDTPLRERLVHLMPGVRQVVPRLSGPLAVWANTREAGERDLRHWLDRAGLAPHFTWVVTSVDAGARKPSAAFFEYAFALCGVAAAEVLFVGNQLNTDIAGAEAYGIRTVWLSGEAYRSTDDAPCQAQPTYTIPMLHDLPALVDQLRVGS